MIDLDKLEALHAAANDKTWVPSEEKTVFVSALWNAWPTLSKELRELRAALEYVRQDLPDGRWTHARPNPRKIVDEALNGGTTE